MFNPNTLIFSITGVVFVIVAKCMWLLSHAPVVSMIASDPTIANINTQIVFGCVMGAYVFAVMGFLNLTVVAGYVVFNVGDDNGTGTN